jgi:hypothetical protein
MNGEYLGAFVMRRMDDHLDKLPGKPVFSAVNGSHAYGFSSPESDIDVRAVHMLPLSKLLGIEGYSGTFISKRATEDAPVVELDLQSTELLTACRRIVHADAVLLEALYSPLVTVKNRSLYTELRAVSVPFIRSKSLARHYRGYSYGVWQGMEAQNPTWKGLCHAFRTALTGLYALENSQMELRLPVLAEKYGYPENHHVIEQKVKNAENELITTVDFSGYRELFTKAFNQLVAAIATSCKEPDNADVIAVEDVSWRYNLLQNIEVSTSIRDW